MPLSKEFYLDEIKSKYPNSYNESLKDLPIKDLEDMLDFLESALSKADGGSIGIEVLFGPKREDFRIGGFAQRKVPYDSRATAEDFANALKNVSAGTTYQQQADAKRYATQEANRMLTDAFKSGNINQLAKTFNFQNDPNLRFEKNRSGIYGLTQANRENVLKNMANQMLNTTSYGVGTSAPDPFQKQREELEKIKTENKRIYDEYIKNNPPLGIITGGPAGKPPSPGLPPYQDQKLLDQLTKLTPLQASYFDPFDQLSDIDQYNLSLAFPELKSQLRNPNQPRLGVMPDPAELFSRRYGIKDGGRVGFRDGGHQDFPPFKGPKGKKRGFETVMDGPDAGAAARAYLAQQKQQKQLQPTQALASTPKPSLENMNRIRESMTAYGFSEPEILKAIAQAGYAEGGRVGLFMGGPPLEGQALSIYNSMNAYGFTDQQIADALQGQGLYTPSDSSTPETTAPNIINQQLQSGDGGGGITELQETFRTEPGDPKNFRLSQLEGTADYFPPTTMMGKAKNFLQELSSPQVKGTLGTRLANQPRIPLPGAIAAYSRSPFNIESSNYNPLMEAQLNFAETQEGIIGRDPNSGLLKYGPESVLSGKNVISMFGTNDYEKMLVDYITKMNANKRISATTKAAKLAQAQKELEELQKKTEAARAAQYGSIDYGRGSDGQRSYSGDAIGAGNLGFGIGATTGGPVSNRTGRGRQDYSKGGLATMFKRKR